MIGTEMVIDVRGTNGSGKSYLIRSLLDRYTHELLNSKENVDYHVPAFDAVVLGRYYPLPRGCDCFSKDIERQVCDRVRKYALRYRYVILEGIVVAHTFERFARLASEVGDYHFVFLDTPLDVCVSNCRSRRIRKGNDKPFDPKNVISDFHSIRRVRDKCLAGSYNVSDFGSSEALARLLEALYRGVMPGVSRCRK